MEIVRQKNVATYIFFPLRDADGLNVSASANPDSEIDIFGDGAAPDGFIDCTNEAVEIGTDGWYYLSLTQAEMNADYIAIQIKSDDALTQNILINTKTLTEIGVIDGIVDAITAKTTNLPADPASETNVNANETKIDAVKTDTAAILVDTDTMEADLKTYMDTKETNIVAEVDANETKIDLIQVDTTAIDGKTTNLPVDPASETNVDANETKIDTTITDIGNLNNLSSANIQTILETNDLDHLIQVSAGAEKPTIGSYLDKIMNKDGSQTHDPTTDSQEAQVDAGGTGDWSANQKTEIATVLGITDTGTPDSTPSDGVLKEVQDNIDTNEGKIDTIDGVVDAILIDTDTLEADLKTEINANETKIDTLQTDLTSVKTKTDNLPANTENELIMIKGAVGIHHAVCEFTFDANNDNTQFKLYIYNTKANAEAHVKGGGLQTGGLYEGTWTSTYDTSYPDVLTRVVEP